MTIDKFDNGSIVNIPVDKFDAMVVTAERRMGGIARVTEMAICNTEPKNWQDFGGKPYLDGDGAARILRMFGASVSLGSCRREDREDDMGKYYMYIVPITVSVGNESVDSLGTCSSRDQFFGQITVNGEKTFRPMHEVAEDHVMKKAKANAYGNAAKDLFGIRDLTWERLAEMTDGKISKGNCTGVKFRGGGQGGKQGKVGGISQQQIAKMMKLKEALGITDENKNDFWAFFNKYNVKWKTADGHTAGKIIKDMEAALEAKNNDGDPGSDEMPPWARDDDEGGLI